MVVVHPGLFLSGQVRLAVSASGYAESGNPKVCYSRSTYAVTAIRETMPEILHASHEDRETTPEMLHGSTDIVADNLRNVARLISYSVNGCTANVQSPS